MMENKKQVSVLIPALNESDTIPELVTQLHVLEQNNPNYEFEFVLVDDGSTDGTAQIFNDKAHILTHAVTVSHYFNEGLTAALISGVRKATHQYIFFLPGDLQYSPEIIPAFVDKAYEGYDIVTGTKQGAYEKRFISDIYNRLSRFLFKVTVRDINSVKLFDRRIIENLELHKDWHRYIVPLAALAGKKMTELPVALYPRLHGESKFSGKLRIIIGVFDMISVRLLWSFKQKPMLIFGSLGFLNLFLGFLSGCYFTYSRLISPLPYEPSTMFVALFILAGLLFLMAGFLGEILVETIPKKEHL